MMSSAIKVACDAFAGILDLIYPPHCLICRAADEDYLCAECIEQINPITPPFCRKCGGVPGTKSAGPSFPPFEGGTKGGMCADCQAREYHFEVSRSAAIYEGVLRDAVHQLKYMNHIGIAEPLAEIMARALPDANLPRVDVAIPIPIHASRLLRRGFNQSEELARLFCKRVDLPLENGVLRKSKKTKRQMELPFDLRVSNVQGSFRASHEERIRGKRVLLIDDVFTTGSTLDEAAKVLLQAGAASVSAYTLSKSL